MENKAIIEAHNARPDATFQMGQTPFADFTGDEFKHKLLKYDGKQTLTQKRADKLARVEAEAKGLNIPGVESPANLGRRRPKDVSQFPRKFDWAEVPEVMGKIHTQETSCASCWAYTSTDTIEAQVVISGRRDKHVELSAEQLINCDGYDSGCNTGNMFTAYEWIHENGGLATARGVHGAACAAAAASTRAASASASAALGAESELAAEPRASVEREERGEPGGGRRRKVLDSSAAAEASRMEELPREPPGSRAARGYCELDFEAGEAALMEAVSKHPVAIGINANKVFQLYASGIISAKDCGPAPHTQDSEIMAINHAVVVTGWGEQMVKGRNMKYWILKNSFGEQWGEGGYFKLERGDHTLDARGSGRCGMYFESVYPVLDEKAGPEVCVPGSTFRTKYYSAAGAAFLGDAADGSSARTRGIELGGEGRVAATMLAQGSPRGWRRRRRLRRRHPSPTGGAAEPTRRAPRSYPTDEPI